MNHPGDLLSGIQRLKRATAKLQQQWNETREHWNDQSAKDFENTYLEPLLPPLRLVTSVTDELNDKYRKAFIDCRDADRPEHDVS